MEIFVSAHISSTTVHVRTRSPCTYMYMCRVTGFHAELSLGGGECSVTVRSCALQLRELN